MNLLDAFQYWVDDARAQGLSQSTINTYVSAIRNFNAWLEQCNNSTAIESIESNSARTWARELMTDTELASKRSNATVATYIAAMKSVWKVLCEEGLVEKNVFESIKSPKIPRRTIEAFSPQQIQQMLDVIPNTRTGLHKKYIIAFLLDTGLRVSELTSIDLGHLDLDNCWVKVIGKGDKQRVVPLSERLVAHTKDYVTHIRFPPKSGKPLLVSITRNRTTSEGVRRMIMRLGEVAGIEGVHCSPHTFRHTFARQFLENGGDAFSLQAILGHSAISTTMRYARMNLPAIQNVHRRASPLEHLYGADIRAMPSFVDDKVVEEEYDPFDWEF